MKFQSPTEYLELIPLTRVTRALSFIRFQSPTEYLELIPFVAVYLLVAVNKFQSPTEYLELIPVKMDTVEKIALFQSPTEYLELIPCARRSCSGGWGRVSISYGVFRAYTQPPGPGGADRGVSISYGVFRAYTISLVQCFCI